MNTGEQGSGRGDGEPRAAESSPGQQTAPDPAAHLPPRFAGLGYALRPVSGGTDCITEVILPPLCDVPAGESLMGSDPKQDLESDRDERPQHPVLLPAFRIARFPVTVAEYARFVRTTGHKHPKRWNLLGRFLDWPTQLQSPDHPVVMVSWHDATAYAAWVAQLTGEAWRLPTEAEWEKAARWDAAAGVPRIYPWGDAFDVARCNAQGSGIGATTPVGSYPAGASPCGAQEIAGNVWEWTNSRYGRYPYRSTDGREAPSVSNRHVRMVRGAGFRAPAMVARCAGRGRLAPTTISDSFGFRLVLASPYW
jgi:formylglycine-generating enzyme required for sulfatase activity